MSISCRQVTDQSLGMIKCISFKRRWASKNFLILSAMEHDDYRQLLCSLSFPSWSSHSFRPSLLRACVSIVSSCVSPPSSSSQQQLCLGVFLHSIIDCGLSSGGGYLLPMSLCCSSLFPVPPRTRRTRYLHIIYENTQFMCNATMPCREMLCSFSSILTW